MTQPPQDPRSARPAMPQRPQGPSGPPARQAPEDHINGPTELITHGQLNPRSAPRAAGPADDANGPTEMITRDQLNLRPPVQGPGPGAPHRLASAAGYAAPPAPGGYAGPQPPAVPPIVPPNPPGAWPQSGAAGAGYPMPPEPAQKPRSKRVVMIGGVVVAVVAVAAAGIAVMRSSDSTSGTSSAASATATTSSSAKNGADGVYRVVPQKLLPTVDEVQKATLYSVTASGEIATSPANDVPTVPAICAASFTSNSLVSWGAAIADAGQLYRDGTGDDFSHSVWAGLAVFRAPADAAASMKLVGDSAKGCTGTFTSPSPGKPPTTWNMDNAQVQDTTAHWQMSQPSINGSGQWVCSFAYGTKGNLTAAASTCGQVPNDGPVQLVDSMLAKATK